METGKKKKSDFKETVLLVEDNPIFLKAMAKQLEALGIQAVSAENIEEAREKIKHDNFHAAVIDVFLGDDDARVGLDLLQDLQILEIPIIIMTARVDLQIAKNALNNGAFYLLEKPFSPETLRDILHKAWNEGVNIQGIVTRYIDKYQLTKAEKNICRLILKGLSNQEIAELTHTSLKTVKTHVSNIFAKCQVQSRTELINDILQF